MGSNNNPFKFEPDQTVAIACSGEAGTITGRAEYTNAENQYLVHYKAADGRATTQWWDESKLEATKS